MSTLLKRHTYRMLQGLALMRTLQTHHTLPVLHPGCPTMVIVGVEKQWARSSYASTTGLPNG